MSEFRMPALGADMEAGTLVQWLKHPGDQVKRGDIIAVVDTQKGAIEIEVFEDGIIESVQVQAGERVPVGTVLALIRGAGAPAPSTPPVEKPARVHASPAARKLAEERHIDLAQVHGTGPEGAVTREDIEGAAPAKAEVADRAGAMRQAIAAAMSRSKRDIPHYYLSTTIDMSAALSWLAAENQRRSMPDRLLPIALLVKAVALAVHQVPELNGHWVDGAFRRALAVHIGCAISLRGGGLIAPAVHDADRKDLGTLMREIRDLTGRVRSGSLRSSELTDATITVTNLGDQGVDAAFGIIYPPQVALVGFGRIAERPWAQTNTVQVRPQLTTTLSGDHRASDGHRGGVFLAGVARLLQTPDQL
jgi:pyruvate dehydrogenase E2 component (dihydrolipoamide acetyltransferase)